ncbi:MAG: 4-hydroxy-3-methylbut-2-enyl diphosphate reductase [Nanoarchaeota archaeon]|nr:4-hydroxy-3-methylbut-2-enyl diphosphate reductase [Nanoarchaeota archaeon]MBU1704745.1 4-hydroxy-3-methylbut-2-enyl diphosphate reductase [Nanoarchaeota archaeon]
MGFCAGVQNAVDLVRKILSENPEKRIFLSDELIHNPIINHELKQKGIIFLSQYSNMPEQAAIEKYVTPKDIFIIPAFGISKSSRQVLEKIGCETIDTTCPSVKAVINKIIEFTKQGYTILYYGKPKHPETEAAVSYADNYIVIHSLEDIADKKLDKVGLVAQTTMLRSKVNKVFDEIETKLGKDNVKRINTVCGATQVRQDAVEKLAQDVKTILVIGGYNSSNTKNLAKVAANKGAKVYHIDGNPDKITKEKITFQPVGSDKESTEENWYTADIGITSGASTPDEVTEKIIEKINNF